MYDKRPFADSVLRMKPDELQALYDSCFDSVKDRIDRCIDTTGTDSERQSLVMDMMYLSVVGKTLASAVWKPVNVYDMTEDESSGEVVFRMIAYEPEKSDVSFLDENKNAFRSFMASYEPVRVAEDHPDVWK